jgi:hypothetical protein
MLPNTVDGGAIARGRHPLSRSCLLGICAVGALAAQGAVTSSLVRSMEFVLAGDAPETEGNVDYAVVTWTLGVVGLSMVWLLLWTRSLKWLRARKRSHRFFVVGVLALVGCSGMAMWVCKSMAKRVGGWLCCPLLTYRIADMLDWRPFFLASDGSGAWVRTGTAELLVLVVIALWPAWVSAAGRLDRKD